jgi:hypothetical protein
MFISTSPLSGGSKKVPKNVVPEMDLSSGTTSSALALASLDKCVAIHRELFNCTDCSEIPLLANLAAESFQEANDYSRVARSMLLAANNTPPFSTRSSPPVKVVATVKTSVPFATQPLPTSANTPPFSPSSPVTRSPSPVKVVATVKTSVPLATQPLPTSHYTTSNTMPSPLARLSAFRQNLQDMIAGKRVGTTPAMPPSPLSANALASSSPSSSLPFLPSPSSFSSSSSSSSSSPNTNALMTLNTSMFGETHREENAHSFERLQNLNSRVTSIKNKLAEIANGHAYTYNNEFV